MNGEKQRGLFGELWYFISGEWVVDARKREEARKQQMIEDMPMPLCGDKAEHLENMTCFGYCIPCRVIESRQSKRRETEELADMIAKRVLEGLRDNMSCT